MSKSAKGIFCPDCHGVRLFTTHRKTPVPGKLIRYKQCSHCGCRLKTEERVVPHSRPRKKV